MEEGNMKKLLELGNRYAKNSDWTDFALTKICLCSLGVLIGLNIPKRSKKTAAILLSISFAGTYAILMNKVFNIAKEMADRTDA